jgi:hypothetical protein
MAMVNHRCKIWYGSSSPGDKSLFGVLLLPISWGEGQGEGNFAGGFARPRDTFDFTSARASAKMREQQLTRFE